MRDLSMIPGLTSERWLNARQRAQETIRNSVKQPVESAYSLPAFSSYPNWLIRGIVGLLAVVAFSAFWISAGKQVSATALILDPLVTDYHRLSGQWVDASILLVLAMGEAGSILFSIAASVLAGDPVHLKRFSFKPTALIFRCFAFICAMFAILANVTITAIHRANGAEFYAWFLTLAAPCLVLAIGLVIERLVMQSLKARAEQKSRYAGALIEYQKTQDDPELHKDFKAVWARAVYDEMIRYKKDRDLILPLVNDDPQIKALLVQREYQNHMVWEAFEMRLDALPRPTLAPPVTESAGAELQTLG
jgi:hypothetical protein